MALVLPVPSAPATGHADQARAHRAWQEGQRHAERESWAQAAACHGRAAKAHDDPAYGLAWVHALIKAGDADQAQQRARALRAARPLLTLAATLESHALLACGRAGLAVDSLLALPEAAERDRFYWGALATALQRCGRHDEAIGAFMKALAQKIDDPVMHYYLGMSFKDKGMKAEAAECVRTALMIGLDSSQLAAHGQLVFYEREACRWPQAEAERAALRAAVQAAPDHTALETSPFPHAVLVDDPLEQLKVARHYALHVASMAPPLPRRAAKAHAGPLRLAYLSSDFHHHATCQLMVEMLEHHDRSRFEVHLISGGPNDGSPIRRRVEAACHRFHDLRGQTQRAMAQHVRALNIDILVDLKGATFDTLMRVTAHRPAPVQVSWLGFPGTSGAPFVDYFIGDPVVTPLEHAGHFSEKIAQLPHCYQPNDAQRLQPAASRRADWGVPEDRLLLCAFHQSYKISEAVFDQWCALLHRLPNAVLWLLQWNTNVQATLVAAAQARGIDRSRLVFAPLLPVAQHLSRLACADLYLDAWPCNAHTTASEALWVGVPVVTLIGPTFAQRVAASLLSAVDCPQLVADTPARYADTVVALGQDPARRAALRQHLRQQSRQSPLFDGRRFARDIEALYDRMWARAVAGLPPDHLPAMPPPAMHFSAAASSAGEGADGSRADDQLTAGPLTTQPPGTHPHGAHLPGAHPPGAHPLTASALPNHRPMPAALPLGLAQRSA